MFNAEFWKSGINITVELFCKYLQENIPPQAIMCVCGNSRIYMHMEEDGSAFSIDDSSLSDLPEYEGRNAKDFSWVSIAIKNN